MSVQSYPSNREADESTMEAPAKAGRCTSKIQPGRETCLYREVFLFEENEPPADSFDQFHRSTPSDQKEEPLLKEARFPFPFPADAHQQDRVAGGGKPVIFMFGRKTVIEEPVTRWWRWRRRTARFSAPQAARRRWWSRPALRLPCFHPRAPPRCSPAQIRTRRKSSRRIPRAYPTRGQSSCRGRTSAAAGAPAPSASWRRRTAPASADTFVFLCLSSFHCINQIVEN